MTRLTLDAVYEYADGVCFKNGPPGTVGAETEWFVIHPEDPARYVSLNRVRALLPAAGGFPAGSRLTFEPGGQLELSSRPRPGPAAACRSMGADLSHARRLLAAAGLALAGTGVDPHRTPRLQETADRYACMFAYFGMAGLDMMCTTASVQVCLDVGADRADAVRRWRLAHALGPMFVAAFANSPVQAGRRTGLRSTRQAIWAGLDPGRTLPVRASGDGPAAWAAGAGWMADGPAQDADDPAASWARYALDARLMLMPDGHGGWIANPGLTFREWLEKGEPALEDLTYHLSTLFPPVRPRGWLELRMIDALPEPYWPVPVAVAAALLDDPAATAIAEAAVEPCAERWTEAARDALTDPPLARAARTCFAAAQAALLRQGAAPLARLVAAYAERYVERGRCPADDVIDPAPPRKRRRSPEPHEQEPHEQEHQEQQEEFSWLSRN
ncbi:MAG TPA: ergothioneine biosynthesis glutamate--cysteine ligase EgtA [Streptosporangiaceae bacterium]